MTAQGKKELKIEEVSSVAGGTTVGPVKENRPMGNIDTLNHPNEFETGPLAPGPMEMTELTIGDPTDSNEIKTGPLKPHYIETNK